MSESNKVDNLSTIITGFITDFGAAIVTFLGIFIAVPSIANEIPMALVAVVGFGAGIASIVYNAVKKIKLQDAKSWAAEFATTIPLFAVALVAFLKLVGVGVPELFTEGFFVAICGGISAMFSQVFDFVTAVKKA